MAGHTLSDKAMADLARMKREVLGGQPPQGTQPAGGGIPPGFWYHAKLTSALSAGSMTAPTTATFDVYFPDQSDSDPKQLIVSGNSVLIGLTLTNHTGASGNSGTYIKVQWGFGQWTLFWADC